MLKRLEHIVQYRNAWELHNADEDSILRNALAISIKSGEHRSGGRIRLKPRDRVTICVHNRSKEPVSAALMYFAPDWRITRVWPRVDPAYAELKPTGAHGFEVQVMKASLPKGVASSIERLKLFATQNDRPTSFDILLLDTLDQARPIARSGLSGPRNQLEAILDSMVAGAVARELVPVAHTGDWGTAVMELETLPS
jgi:hypothetical protein